MNSNTIRLYYRITFPGISNSVETLNRPNFNNQWTVEMHTLFARCSPHWLKLKTMREDLDKEGPKKTRYSKMQRRWRIDRALYFRYPVFRPNFRQIESEKLVGSGKSVPRSEVELKPRRVICLSLLKKSNVWRGNGR